MTILDYVKHHSETIPQKDAIIHEGVTISYGELYVKMLRKEPLPIPLLGEGWDQPFILLTTGSTGKPKRVIISQEAVIANSENLIDGNGYTSETVFIVAGALEHLGSWSKFFPVLILGGTLIILDSLKDFGAFFQALDYPSNHLATFLVPSKIRMLIQFSREKLASYADRLDFIEAGGAPMPHSDMLELCRILPNTRLYNTYASTETGVICTYNFNDGRQIPMCVGRPMKHSRGLITEDGLIACQGPTLMSGYQGEPEQTHEVLRDGVLYTKDRGEIDEEGMLHILGRSDDIINVGGLKVAPSEVEEVALALPEIKECICISVPHNILGRALKLLVVLAVGQKFDKRSMAQQLGSKLESYKVPLYYEVVDTIARTANGKLDRKYYKKNEN